MGSFARNWQKVLQQIKHSLISPRARILERKLAAARSEKQVLLSEISSAGAELEQIRRRDREQLKAFEQRLEHIESEREATQHRLQTLQHSLTEAVSGLESTKTQVEHLDSRLEKERRKRQAVMQDARDQALRQERRLNRVLTVAGFAFLLVTVASVTGILDTRHNTRVMVELSQDIRDIKASMQRQTSSMRESLQGNRLPPFEAISGGQFTDSKPALTGIPEEQTDKRQRESATTLSTFRFHPHNKYQTRPEMEAFFEENARQPGVISLASGLQYKVLSRGNGRSPGPNDEVVFDYRAFLPDGTEIYNSYDAAEPVVFGIDQVMPGLREALLRMEEGAQWELYIPPALAYLGGTRKRKRHGYEPLIYVVVLRTVIEGGQSIENQIHQNID